MTTTQYLIAFIVTFVVLTLANIALFKFNEKLAMRARPIFDLVLSYGSVAVLFFDLTAGAIILGALFGMAFFGSFVGAYLARATIKESHTPVTQTISMCVKIALHSVARCFGFNYAIKF